MDITFVKSLFRVQRLKHKNCFTLDFVGYNLIFFSFSTVKNVVRKFMLGEGGKNVGNVPKF